MKFDLEMLFEQMAILFASAVWTTVVLTAVTMFWMYQDVQARWNFVLESPPEAMAQAADTPTAQPTATPWAGPGPTATRPPPGQPTATPTRVVEPPSILPETPNEGEAVSAPVEPEAEPDPAPVEESAPAPDSNAVAPTIPAAAPAPAATPTVSGPELGLGFDMPSPVNEPEPLPPGIVGNPTRITIPSVNIQADVVPVGWQVVEQNNQEYSIWQVANFAVGWHKTTAPLGQPGNTVLAGHHNVHGEVFRDLVNVEVGDSVTIYSNDQTYQYVVELKTIVKEKGESLEVRQRNAQWISATDDERITMVTCWPYTNNTHRVIVVAKPVR